MPEELTLLPCPACGNPDAVVSVTTRAAVYCPMCGMCGPCSPKVDTEYAIRQWNALPRALTWTTEPPKVPGLYWTRKMKGDPPIIFTIYERNTPKGRVRIEARIFFSSVTSRTYRGEKPEHLGLEWAGPIPEPREPK